MGFMGYVAPRTQARFRRAAKPASQVSCLNHRRLCRQVVPRKIHNRFAASLSCLGFVVIAAARLAATTPSCRACDRILTFPPQLPQDGFAGLGRVHLPAANPYATKAYRPGHGVG